MAAKGRNAVSLLKGLVKNDPEFDRYYQEAHVNAAIAQMIYDARKEAGLTQTELAKLVGTTQSVISQLEDADYEGHSLTMLQRVASVLQKKVEVRFVPTQVIEPQQPQLPL
jgi:DNA-binding XRE family transcriptional regulator